MDLITIQYVDEQGDGHARWHDQWISIPQALPGEVYQIGVDRRSRQREKKLITKRVEASPQRREPPCSYYAECGGCQLQHVAESEQRELKWSWLRRNLATIVPESAFKTIESSPQDWNYRRRIQVHLSPQGKLGFFAANSRRVIPVKACPIAAEPVNLALRALQQSLEEGKSLAGVATYELTLEENGEVLTSSREDRRVFLQGNPGANLKLISFLRQVFAAGSYQHVLELFAGTGNFTIPLSESVQSWIAVESQASAVALGKQSTKSKVEWCQSSAEPYLKSLKRNKVSIDLLLLDPPREGAVGCMKEVLRLRIPQVLYISCSPNSLRRDLKWLCENGYEVEWVQAFDFFPQTMHVETVVLLKRREQDTRD